MHRRCSVLCNTMYVHVLYNKIHLLKNLRMKQPVQVNPGLNCSFSYENCIYIYIYIYILLEEIKLKISLFLGLIAKCAVYYSSDSRLLLPR